jgi:hypothetical protein
VTQAEIPSKQQISLTNLRKSHAAVPIKSFNNTNLHDLNNGGQKPNMPSHINYKKARNPSTTQTQVAGAAHHKTSSSSSRFAGNSNSLGQQAAM